MKMNLLISSFMFASVMNGIAHSAELISLQQAPDRLVVKAGDDPLLTYVFADKEISRPYFAHVHAPGGIQVTRNHPPIPDQDRVDHATFHPGIWLAFGDISGQDYWRNSARVRHDRIAEVSIPDARRTSFTTQNSYCRADSPDDVICRETCRYTILIDPKGYTLICDSVFISPTPFAFGDQEEMGLGVRMATALTVTAGGQILDSAGNINEKQVWGKPSKWCDYSGVINGRRVGVLVLPDPTNFRPSRLHVRDYGLLTANPFGQKAFGDPEASRVEIPAATPFRLRFAILLHTSNAGQDLDRVAATAELLRQLSDSPRPNP